MLGSGTHCSKIDRFLGTHAKGATESNKEKKDRNCTILERTKPEESQSLWRI